MRVLLALHLPHSFSHSATTNETPSTTLWDQFISISCTSTPNKPLHAIAFFFFKHGLTALWSGWLGRSLLDEATILISYYSMRFALLTITQPTHAIFTTSGNDPLTIFHSAYSHHLWNITALNHNVCQLMTIDPQLLEPNHPCDYCLLGKGILIP